MRTPCAVVIALSLLLGTTGPVAAQMNKETVPAVFVTGTATNDTAIEDEGHASIWHNNDEHAGGPLIFAAALSIVDDEGAWRGIPDVYLVEEASGDQVLVGEGAHEGLTAIATVDLEGEVWTWHGWIIEGGLPPLPTEPEAIP